MAMTPPDFIPEPFASEGQFATIPDTPSSEQGRASWQQGFPAVCAQPLASGGIPPNYLDFQGIFNALSAHLCYSQTGALWPWSASLEYPAGAHVLGSDNNEYVAVQENAGQDPTQSSAGAYWKNVTDLLMASYLPLSGGTMTGNLTLAGNPTASLQAATKQYVDGAVAACLPLSGGTMTGNLTLAGNPTASLQAATKQYVDQNRGGDLTNFIGMIAPFAATHLPSGWMICDGSSVLFADWPEFKAAYNAGRFSGMTVSKSTPAQVGKFVVNGSTGVYLPDLEGLFVQASAAGSAGAYVAAGLPNIKGSIWGGVNQNAGVLNADGAFYIGNVTDIALASGNAQGAGQLLFSAKGSSSIYSDSVNTVQPPAVRYCLAMYLGQPAA